MRFSLTQRQRDDRVVPLTRAGEVDLRTAIQDSLRTPHPADVVDLGRVTFLDCAGIGALPAGRHTAVGRGRGHPVGQPAAARAPGPGDHRCPQGARPARGFGAADRSGGAVTTIPAPPKRPAGSGWTAAVVDGRRVRVPGECELVVEKWSLTALVDGLLSHALSASSRRSTGTVHGGRPYLLCQTVIASAGGQTLDEHENPSEATVQVLRGRVRTATGDDTRDGSTGAAADLVRRPAHGGDLGGRDPANHGRRTRAAEEGRPEGRRALLPLRTGDTAIGDVGPRIRG